MSEPPADEKIKAVISARRFVRPVRLESGDGSDLREFIQARLNRADEHIEELKRDFKSLQETDRQRIVPEMSADMTEISIHVLYARPHPNRRWAVIVGDIAHDLRSALDNAVYAIALTHSRTVLPPDNGRLAFPIADTEADWKRDKGRIRTLPEDARTLISDAQPCHGGDALLSLLGHLNDMDKHRLPAVAAAGILGGNLPTFNERVGSYPNVTVLEGPAIGDAPLLRFTFAEPQPTRPEMDLRLSFQIFLLHEGHWLPAIQTLQQVRVVAEGTVRILEPFIGNPATP